MNNHNQMNRFSTLLVIRNVKQNPKETLYTLE